MRHEPGMQTNRGTPGREEDLENEKPTDFKKQRSRREHSKVGGRVSTPSGDGSPPPPPPGDGSPTCVMKDTELLPLLPQLLPQATHLRRGDSDERVRASKSASNAPAAAESSWRSSRGPTAMAASASRRPRFPSPAAAKQALSSLGRASQGLQGAGRVQAMRRVLHGRHGGEPSMGRRAAFKSQQPEPGSRLGFGC